MRKAKSQFVLLSALLPLIMFWVVEEFWGLKAALIVGCVFAVVEIAWEKFFHGKVPFLTWASNGLVLGLGAVSFGMQSGIAFKLQPMVMEIATAVLMVAIRFKGDVFLLRMFKEFPGFDEKQKQFFFSQPWLLERIRKTDTRLIAFFVLHGLIVGWAAVWGSTRAWILLKGVLFYVLLVLVVLPMYKRPIAHGNTEKPKP